MARSNPSLRRTWAVFALLSLAFALGVVPALADGTSRTATTYPLKMTGLRGSVPASTSRSVTTYPLKMTGLRGSVPASTSRSVTTYPLKMTGLRP